MNAVGNGVFGALPLIFAVGIAAGLAKAEKGSAGLSAVVGYFVLLTGTGAFMSILGKEAPSWSRYSFIWTSYAIWNKNFKYECIWRSVSRYSNRSCS